METGEDRDRQRRRHSLWGRAKWQLPYSWRYPRVTKTELDTPPLTQPTDSRAHEGHRSLCSPRSSPWNRSSPVVPQLAFSKTPVWCVDNPLRLCPLFWQKTSYKTFVLFLRSWHSPLCPQNIFFLCSVKKLNVSDRQISSNKQLTRFWFANLFTTFQIIASHSQACKTDSSWNVEHEINEEYVFVTAVDWTVAGLFNIIHWQFEFDWIKAPQNICARMYRIKKYVNYLSWIWRKVK